MKWPDFILAVSVAALIFATLLPSLLKAWMLRAETRYHEMLIAELINRLGKFDPLFAVPVPKGDFLVHANDKAYLVSHKRGKILHIENMGV